MSLPEQMNAVLFQAPGQLTIERVPVPRPALGEVIVRVGTALTCGTDLKAYLRGHRLFRPPMPFGHEFCGIVAAVGDGVDRFREGDRVTAANSAPCRECFYCKRGQSGLCDRLDENLNWGAYAEYINVPAAIVRQNMLLVPAHVDDATAAAVEPLACVVAGLDAAELSSGETVVVLGATGAIGLMFVQMLRWVGAGQIIAIGRDPARLELARALGADDAVGADDQLATKVHDLTGGRGADVVIEATGQPAVWEMAPDLLRRGGTAIMFGGCPSGTRFSLDTGRVHYDALTIRGVFHHTPATVDRAFAALTSGRVAIAPLIGAEGSLEATEELLRQMARREIIKAAIRP